MNLIEPNTSNICFYLIKTRWLNPNQAIRAIPLSNSFIKVRKTFSTTVASICSQNPYPPSTFISHTFRHNLLIENHPGKQLYLLFQKSYISKSIPLAKMKSLQSFPLLGFIIYQEFLFHFFPHFLLRLTST